MQRIIEDHVAFKYFVGRRDGTRLPQPLQVSIHFAEIQGYGRLFLGEYSQPVPTAPVAIVSVAVHLSTIIHKGNLLVFTTTKGLNIRREECRPRTH